MRDIIVHDNGGKTTDRYTVFIGRSYEEVSDAWYMSDNANQPNGVCMYEGEAGIGEAEDPDAFWRDKDHGNRIVQLAELPTGTLVQIIHLLQEEE